MFLVKVIYLLWCYMLYGSSRCCFLIKNIWNGLFFVLRVCIYGLFFLEKKFNYKYILIFVDM